MHEAFLDRGEFLYQVGGQREEIGQSHALYNKNFVGILVSGFKQDSSMKICDFQNCCLPNFKWIK